MGKIIVQGDGHRLVWSSGTLVITEPGHEPLVVNDASAADAGRAARTVFGPLPMTCEDDE